MPTHIPRVDAAAAFTNPGLGRWVRAPGVLSCAHGDTTTILALREGRRGRYLTLNQVGSLVWTHLLRDPDADPIPSWLAEQYGIPDAVDSIRADVQSLLIELRRRRLLQPASLGCSPQARTSDPPGVPAPSLSVISAQASSKAPSLLLCFITLSLAYAALRLLGLRRLLLFLYHLPARGGLSPSYLNDTVAMIERAGLLVPFRAQCLEQSLCLLAFARRTGADARLRIGVLPFPFEAHAWVEHLGVPINDTIEQLQLYRAFPPLDVEALA